jgi:hypothetical protein
VIFYQISHPRFSVDWPPNPTKQTIAKKARKERHRRGGKRENTLTLPQVVQAIAAIPPDRQPIFWALCFTQCRVCEARGVLGHDYISEDEGEGLEKGRLFIERSAAAKSANAEIRNTTKTGVDGSYLLPEFVQELIARHCSHARLDPDLPLFRNPHRLAGGDLYSDDAIRDTWETALSHLGLSWVPVYRAMKHTQVSALRAAGMPVDDIVEQCRWASPDMMSVYDTGRDKRRDGVVQKLNELVGDVLIGTAPISNPVSASFPNEIKPKNVH